MRCSSFTAESRSRNETTWWSGSSKLVAALGLHSFVEGRSTGLNLTAANHVFHFDRWWNPAVENQATDRAFRIGQTKNVQVHKFVCAGTLEDKIDEMIEQKKDIAEQVVGAGEGWITELSNKDLKQLGNLEKKPWGNEMSSWYYREYYTPAVPRKVNGGIKAHTKRGNFGQSWWAKRWIAVLESFNIGARLGRGRSYARRGQVVSIAVEKGSIKGAVQERDLDRTM